MDEDRERFIVSKKSKKIDQEDSHKKGKKNRKKDHSESSQDPPPSNESLLKNPPPSNNPPPANKTHNARRKDQEQSFKDLCQIFSTYHPATIRSALQAHYYNKAQAYNALCEIPPDNQYEEPMLAPQRLGKNKSEDNSSTNNSEVAQTIINEVYDNLLKEEINGREFQELFEEIAEMIKEDQRDRGFGMLEINSFVDECRSIEQTILVGFREELSSFDDYEFDQSYPLYAQTQEYILEATLKQAKQEKKQKEDFPTLGSTSTARNGGFPQQRNIIDRISQDQRRRVQQETSFFAPRKNVPSYAKERINQASIFNVDNKLRSERDLMSLHKQFLNMPIRDLKFVYVTFLGDYNISREFLIKYYGNTRLNRTEATTSSWRPQAAVIRGHSRLRREEMDEQLKHLSLKEIRDELDHLFKLRQTLQMTKAKIPSAAKKLDIDRLINQKTPLIRKLAQAARLKEVEQMIRGNPLYVDLHGYREEEIEPLLDTIRSMLREQFDRHNERVRTKKVKGRLVACLTIMTGKGIHSRHNRSVLKPATVDWCNARGFDYEEADDHVLAFIAVA